MPGADRTKTRPGTGRAEEQHASSRTRRAFLPYFKSKR